MEKNKIWKVRGKEERYTDEELIRAIKDGTVGPDEAVSTRDMKVWIKVKDSIYQFYLTERREK